MTQVAQIVPFDFFTSKTVLVTGASGLIGSALVDLLSFGNETGKTDCGIFVAGRNVNLLQQRFPGTEVSCIKYDALEHVNFDFDTDIIIDCASPAAPCDFMEFPAETILANVLGVHELIKYANKCHAAKMVYVSSSEVYGKIPTPPSGHVENHYGEVDLLCNRSCYPIAKRAAENMCVVYARQNGINVSIVRPGHIYGPTASKNDNRVSSSFPVQAAQGSPIVLRSSGDSLRSYTHCLDCASAILTVAARGGMCEAYNIASKRGVCSIRQMAEVVAATGNVTLRFANPSASDCARFNPMVNSTLDPSKLEALGWRDTMDFKEGFSMTVECLKSLQKGEQ